MGKTSEKWGHMTSDGHGKSIFCHFWPFWPLLAPFGQRLVGWAVFRLKNDRKTDFRVMEGRWTDSDMWKVTKSGVIDHNHGLIGRQERDLDGPWLIFRIFSPFSRTGRKSGKTVHVVSLKVGCFAAREARRGLWVPWWVARPGVSTWWVWDRTDEPGLQGTNFSIGWS